MALPGGAQLINTHEDLLTAFTNIDQRLHRIIGGNDPPYIYRNKLYLPASMYSIALGQIGSGGERLHGGDATHGPFATGEDMASTAAQQIITNSHLTIIRAREYQQGDPLVGTVPPFTDATAQAAARKYVVATHTCDGAGALGATDIVPAKAGYYGVIDNVEYISDQTDAAHTLTWASTTGITGHGTFACATVADTNNTQMRGQVMYGNADNEAITLAIANHAANAVVTLSVTFHYET